MWEIIEDQSITKIEYQDVPATTLKRRCEYINNSSDAVIKELCLSSYCDGAYRVAVDMRSQQHFYELIVALRWSPFPEPSYPDYYNHYDLYCDLPALVTFLKMIKAIDTSFAEIEQNVCEFLHINSLSEIAKPERFNLGGFYSTLITAESPVDPSITALEKLSLTSNAKRLEEIDYQEEIPKEYLCAHTFQVMTIPVYDPAYPNFKFELAAIKVALDGKRQNPVTRTLLTKGKIKLDEELKNRIDEFVTDAVNAANKPKSCFFCF